VHEDWEKRKNTILFQSYALIVIFAIFLTWFVTSTNTYFPGEHVLTGYRSKTPVNR